MADEIANSIPNFVKAGSPQGLRRVMLMNNARVGGMILYFDIRQVIEKGKTYWIAWYFDRLRNDDPIMNEGGDNVA